MSLPASNQRLLTYVDALREAVAQEMQRDPRVFVFGLDVDDHKAIQGSTRGLVDVFGPDRVFGTPLSEDAMTGVAIGAAMAGMRPVHVHIRMDFLMLCMNQLVNIAAKSRYMYDGQVKVPLVVRSMIGKSWGQGAQHSQGLHAMFMHVPGLKVVAPSNAYDAKGCLIHAIRDDNPVIFVEHRLLYYTDAYVPEEEFEVPFGRARLCTQGDDITIVGISNMLVEALRAAELLADIRHPCRSHRSDLAGPAATSAPSSSKVGTAHWTASCRRQCLDELRRERRDRRPRRRTGEQRQADPGAADGLRADDLPDHAGAGTGILPRSVQDRAGRSRHGALGRGNLAARCQGRRARLSDEIPRALLEAAPIQHGMQHVLRFGRQHLGSRRT